MLISANKYELTPSSVYGGTSGSIGMEKISFSFSDDWDGLIKKVVFYPVRGQPVEISPYRDGEEIEIPPEITRHSGEASFVVSGYLLSENVIAKKLYSLTGTVIIDHTQNGDGVNSEKVTPDSYDRLLSEVKNEIEDKLTEAALSGEFDGADGISPTVSVSQITNGHKVTITDRDGEKSFNVSNGAKGDKGDKGDTGATGAKGDKGDKGDRGEKGDQGVSGVYVGSGDIPEGYNVQIDPSGDAETNVVSSRSNYGEVVAWFDGNPNNEDRLYRFVTIVGENREIKIADETDQIIGTSNIKSNVGFIGNYRKGDENDIAKALVSILGVSYVRTNDNTITKNDRVMSDNNGYAIKSTNNLGYRVIRVMESGLLEIVVSPNTDMIQRIKGDIVNLSEANANLKSDIDELKPGVVKLVGVSPNLLDMSTMWTFDHWIYFSGNVGVGNEIAVLSNQYTVSYAAVKIPVTGIKSVTLSTNSYDPAVPYYNASINGWYMADEYMKCLDYRNNIPAHEIDIADGWSIDIPDGTQWLCLTIIAGKLINSGERWLMANSGNEALPYEPYGSSINARLMVHGKTLVTDESADTKRAVTLKLPDEYSLVAGDTFELFYKGIVNAVSPNMYDVEIDCAKGNAYSKRFVWTPTAADAGSHALEVTLYDMEHNMLDKKTVQLIVKEKATSPASAVNVLYVGDSLAVSGEVPAEMKRRLTGTGGTPAADGLGNIEFIGSCKNSAETVRYEGYGGWTFNSYNTSYKSTQYMWITCAGHGKTEADDQHSVYADANSVKWKLETIEDGKIKIIRTSASGTLPASGTLTWVSGGTHTENIVYTASEQADGNPFWDESTEKVDFATYAQRMGVSKIDYVYVLLGWNNAGYAADSYKAQVRIFVDNVLSAYPNCKIVLLGLQLPARDGLGVSYGATGIYSRYYDLMQHVWNLNQLYADIAAEYPDNVTTVNIAGQFDTENNMPSGTRTVNARSTVTEKYQTNGLHPANDGYMQIADACYRDFVHKLQG